MMDEVAVYPVEHAFNVGDKVDDITAIVNDWPDRRGIVIDVDGSQIKVQYQSGETRWKAHIHLRKCSFSKTEMRTCVECLESKAYEIDQWIQESTIRHQPTAAYSLAEIIRCAKLRAVALRKAADILCEIVADQSLNT